jgi:capsular exopolysaccharide synthesis family protein
MSDKLERLAQALAPLPAAELPAPRRTYSLDESEIIGGFSLREQWRVVHGRRWTVLTLAAAGLAAALAWNHIRTPTYQATVTLQIDREQPGLAEISEQASPQFPEQPDYIETQYKVLQSRVLAKTVIAELGLASKPELKHGLSAEELEAYTGGVHPRILERFAGRLKVRPSKGTRLVDVSYESVDPQLAPLVVNTLGTAFVEHNLRAKWNATQKASVWLEEQLDALRIKLETSEQELQRYAASHSILFVEERKDVTTEKLAQLEEELTRAESDRVMKESLAMLAEGANRSGGSLPGSLSSDAYAEFQKQLSELRREHSRLLVTFAPGYPSVRRVAEEIAQVEEALAAEQERILAGVAEDFTVARQREVLLRVVANRQRSLVNALSGDFIEYNILKRDADTNRQLYEGLLQRLKEAGISAGLRASNIAVLDPAQVPEEPYRPRRAINCVLGLAFGALFGIGLAFVQEHMDTAVRTPEEVERISGLGLLAVVPRSRSEQGRKLMTREESSGQQSVRLWEPEDGVAEAYRTLRSSVLLGWGEAMRRILRTSAQPQEGKTTLSLNLACSLAQLGRNVLLIDADMRRPDCHRHLGINQTPGLSEYLQGLVEMDQVVTATDIPGLSVVASGKSVRAASDLLYSPRLESLFQEASERFEHVVIDSPPSLALSDARTIGRFVESVVLVVSDKTDRNALLRTKQSFDDAGIGFLGFVMNRISLGNLDYGYYRDYGYSYASDVDETRRDTA